MNNQLPASIQTIIKGAGGHGIVVADILWQMYTAFMGIKPVGFLDDNSRHWGKRVMGLEVYGSGPDTVRCAWNSIVVGIGNNRKRCDVFMDVQKSGVSIATCIHPSATIAEDVQIGMGTMVCAGAVINPAVRIGENAIVNTNCTIEHDNVIGNHSHIAPGATLGGEVFVGEGTFIGIGATVLPGCNIGSWSVVGGGAVVVEDIPDRVVCCGVPAKVIKHL